MKDGQFHGKGTIYFTDGGKLDAIWNLGKATEEVYTFADGLVYSETNWDYCTEEDGRFYQERIRGFQDGVPQLSNNATESPRIPINSTDLGYGYYDEGDKMLHWFDGINNI